MEKNLVDNFIGSYIAKNKTFKKNPAAGKPVSYAQTCLKL